MEQIKKQITRKKFELMAAKKDLSTVQSSAGALKAKQEEAELSVDAVISHAREQAKEAALRDSSAELERELAGYEKEYADLRRERSEQLEYYSFENIRKGLLSRSPLGEDTQRLIEKLRQEAYDTISQRFVSAYFASLGKCRVAEGDFLHALDRLEACCNNFAAIKGNKVNVWIDDVIEKMNNFELTDDSEEGKSSGAFVGIGIVSVVLAFIAFPIGIVALCVVFYLNLRKSFSMKESLNLLKVVEDNFGMMEKALDVRSSEECDKKRREITEKFDDAIKVVQADIESVSNDISVERQKVIAEFTFDETDIISDLEGTLSEIEHAMDEQQRSEKALKEKISKIEKEIVELEANYKEAREALIRKYINFDSVGDSRFFPTNFLLDDQEPLTFFERARHSTFFVYKDPLMVIDFLRLICLQTRTRTAPSTVYTQVWDITSSGAGLMCLSNPNTRETSSLFTIVNSTEGIKQELSALAGTMQKRLQTILTSGQDINQYNEDMITLNSVTESYHFILVLSPETVVNDEAFRRLLINGPGLGMYTYIFAETVSLGKQHCQLIESVDYCAFMVNNKVVSNAKSALIEQIMNKSK